jgi:hypothetical protein
MKMTEEQRINCLAWYHVLRKFRVASRNGQINARWCEHVLGTTSERADRRDAEIMLQAKRWRGWSWVSIRCQGEYRVRQ